jgi:hypothetical protein
MSLSSFSSMGHYVGGAGATEAPNPAIDVISNTSLVYYYGLETGDQSGATMKNGKSGGTNDLTLVGTPTISTSIYKCGLASLSTTTGKYASLTNNTNFYSTDATLAFWFRVVSIPAADTFGSIGSCMTSGGSYNWFIQMAKNANNVNFDLGIWMYAGANNSYAISGSTLTYNTWYHIAFVKTGTTSGNLKIYLNNSVVVNATTSSHLTNNGNAKLHLGIDFAQQTHVINGNFDDYRYYQRALTAGEITTLFNNTL